MVQEKNKSKTVVTCCWFDQKPFNAQFHNFEQHPPFTYRLEQENIDGINGYICYSVEEDGLFYGGEAAVTDHQMQSLSSLLMNSLQLKEYIELYQMDNMEEIDIQDNLKYDHINVKIMCQNGFHQLLFWVNE